MSAYMLIQFDAPWDEWKPVFDNDPARRAEIAKGYTLFRGVDSPNDIYVQVELPSIEDAKTLRSRLVDSGVLGGFTVTSPPTVVEVAESKTY